MNFFSHVTKALGSGPGAAACITLVLLASSGQAHAQAPAGDPPPWLQALNRLRQQGCDRGARPVPPLRESAALSGAATRLAGGGTLDSALAASDYRAMRAAQVTLRGAAGTAALARDALGDTCGAIVQGELLEAGFHQRGTQTWVVLAAPFSPPDLAQAGDVQNEVLALVNAARARPRRCGNESFSSARPLRLSATLQDISTAHAADMARYSYFDHTGRDGSRVDGRASRAGYPWRAIGENIAAGQMQPDTAVQGWLKSPGHCANIMSPDFTEMGAAFAVNKKSSAGIYWVQVFGAAR